MTQKDGLLTKCKSEIPCLKWVLNPEIRTNPEVSHPWNKYWFIHHLTVRGSDIDMIHHKRSALPVLLFVEYDSATLTQIKLLKKFDECLQRLPINVSSMSHVASLFKTTGRVKIKGSALPTSRSLKRSQLAFYLNLYIRPLSARQVSCRYCRADNGPK